MKREKRKKESRQSDLHFERKLIFAYFEQNKVDMARSKWCCRIFPVVLILVSAVLAVGIGFLGEGANGFAFLRNSDAFFTFFGTALSIALLPIGIFYFLNEKEKYESRARPMALLGFLPVVIVLAILLS